MPVNTNTIYVIKNFFKTVKLNSGESFFYIDEYDVNGNWISGKYLKGIRSPFVDSLNFTYYPTSANVAGARLQIGISANSGIEAYLDNVQWIPIIDNNLLTNGNFIFGISNGWSTDRPTRIMANNLNLGVAPDIKNSIKLSAYIMKDIHLFSPTVEVESGKKYALSSFVSVTKRSRGEVNFYIEEFDSTGKLISSQKKMAVTAKGKSTINFNYTPTSASVTRARLSIGLTRNSGILAYIDRCEWIEE
jgi:hypothetical protein